MSHIGRALLTLLRRQESVSRRSRLTGFVVGLSLVSVTMSVGGAAAPAVAGPAPGSALVIVFDTSNDPPLLDSTVTRVTGRRSLPEFPPSLDMGCEFDAPPLILQPGQWAIESRQLDLNLVDCTTLIEIGTPADARASASPPEGSAALAAAATRTEASFRIWWEDVVNLAVSGVTAHMRATWDGVCTSNGTGWATDEVLGTTGWSRVFLNHDWGYLNGCTKAQTDSQAKHKNNFFCSPKNIQTNFPDTHVSVSSNGTIAGGNKFTSKVTSSGLTFLPCPPLQRNASLRRDSEGPA